MMSKEWENEFARTDKKYEIALRSYPRISPRNEKKKQE